MSEEILKALTQLFAIITKQDGGVTENERQFVINFFQQELEKNAVQAYIDLYDDFAGYRKQATEERQKLTSVKDSVKTLGICKKINKTLTQKQKIVVLTKLLELVGSDKNFTPQRMEIINTVSTVFNISQDEYKLIETFVIAEDDQPLNFSDILILNSEVSAKHPLQKHVRIAITGHLIFMRVQSVDMFFVKYVGTEGNVMNGFAMQPRKVYLFSHGSTIKTQAGDANYYGDLASHFNAEVQTTKLSFNATIDEFKFPNGAVGLRDIVVSEGPGKLIGIMGASGAGKTTLLTVLAGLEKPSKGDIKINGFDIHQNKEDIEGVIGYVSQDDLLIEELTVYQNLLYNAKLCFANLPDAEIAKKVMEVLTNLGLDQRKDLKVGTPLDKTISGGQRKRLNIALELIREPAVLFLDEPTSGLSSRDSENVIDLLKELSLKGKLIFVVIHQPSSDIYKMFDKMIIMDTGGYPAYYGPPVEAVTYFKKSTHQVDSNRGQCETCGNVNPEQIFNIIESKVVDEYGQPTTKRKVTPPQWHELYQEKFKINKIEDIKERPPQNLQIPNRVKQAAIFISRDFFSKLSNKQYLLINLLEAPALAAILAFIIKYKNTGGGREYVFRYNDNFPAYMLMAIIVALFMGLTVSAEEIIRDRKILKRESFLNLSWNSYLVSKLGILFFLSAIQTFLFVLIGNLILEINGMMFSFWLVMFTTSCMANVLGLNISSAFNSAVTVYVMIPLLLIPQMILSGLLFKFDKLHEFISAKGKVPVVADLMASRWAYEALAVDQFINNDYESAYYEYEKTEADADFKTAFLADELKSRNTFALENFNSKNDSILSIVRKNLFIIGNTLDGEKGLENVLVFKGLSLENYSQKIGIEINAHIEKYQETYQDIYNKSIDVKEKKMDFIKKKYGRSIVAIKNANYNESLADLVKNVTVKERLIEHNGQLIQQINPIFQDPVPSSAMDYRTAFFVPSKSFAGLSFTTFVFNLMVVWIMSGILYITLYFEVLRKLIEGFGKLNFIGKK
jgi:ABC transport system ATP-binding/permease protein